MNKAGFEATNNYIQTHLKEIDETIIENVSTGKNLMKSEDFVTSYAFHKATGFPQIHVPEITTSINGMASQVSIHPLKSNDRIHKAYNEFFDDNGTIRSKEMDRRASYDKEKS